MLVAGLVSLLGVDLMLLRPAFAPLDELADTMRRHDPLWPGARAELPADPDLASLAQTFNDMLDRELGMRDRVERTLYAIRSGLIQP